MELTFRTVVRGFLLVGGSAYFVYGLVDGTTFDIALGAFAAVVGAVGLWSIRIQATDEDADRANGSREDDDPATRDSASRDPDGDDPAVVDPGDRDPEDTSLETHGLEDNE